MKKILFAAALATMGLTSCVSDAVEEILPTEGEKEITFSSPVFGPATRGPLVDDAAFPTTEGFDVWAVWSSDDLVTWGAGTKYMEKVTVTYDGGSYDSGYTQSGENKTGGWHCATPYYWPKNGKLSFAAVYPSGVDATYDATGLTVPDFTVTEVTGNLQTDLMFSERTLNKTTSKGYGNDYYDGIDIKFHHALAQIQFTAKTDVDANTVITLKKIELTGVINKGTFNESLTDGTGYALPSKGANLWTESTTDTDKKTYTGYNSDGLVLTSSLQTLTATTDTGTEGNTGLMLIPQAIPADAKIKVTYTITPYNSTTPIDQVVEVYLSAGSVTSWDWGTRYTYNLTIALEEIYFAPSVTSWTTDSSTSPEVTIQ